MEAVRRRQGKDSGHVSLYPWAQSWAAPYQAFSDVLYLSFNGFSVSTPLGSGCFPLGGDFSQ